MTDTMTLQELVAAAALRLSEADLDQPSGRVSDVPTVRTVRYYASHGLLDKPVAWRGRAALYGPKHLQQLVAIKRLQSRGDSLDVIQERMLSITDAELARLAGFSEDASPPQPQGARTDFWRAPVAAPAPAPASPATDPSSLPLSVGIPLADDVLVLLTDPARPIAPDDLAALQAAALPLLRVLRARHILDS